MYNNLVTEARNKKIQTNDIVQQALKAGYNIEIPVYDSRFAHTRISGYGDKMKKFVETVFPLVSSTSVSGGDLTTAKDITL